jgi:hypothetical protein
MIAHQPSVTMSWYGWCAAVTNIDITTLSRMVNVHWWLMSTSHCHGWLMCTHDWYRYLDIVTDGWYALMTDIDISTLSRILVTAAHQPSVTMSWCKYQSWVHINHPWQCRDVDISDCWTSTIHDDVEMSISVMIAHWLLLTSRHCHGWLMCNHDWYWHIDIVTDGWCAIITDIDITTLLRMVDVQSWPISTSRHRHGWLMFNSH